MDDHNAFTGTAGGGGSGCTSGCLTWLLIGLATLWLIGNMLC